MNYNEVLKTSPLNEALKANGIREISQNHELQNGSGFYYTDVEGPLFKDDHADVLANRTIQPPTGKPIVNFGSTLYSATYEFYTAWTAARRQTTYENYRARNGHGDILPPLTASEGTDISFLAPFLLASGVNMKSVYELVTEIARPIPGAKDHLDQLKRNGIRLTASTTSFRETTDLIIKHAQMPVDQVIGTPLSLDDTEDLLRESRRYHTEISMVQNFLTRCGSIVSEINMADQSADKNRAHLHLQHALADFYQNQLGLSFDPNIRQNGIECPTLLGTIIEANEVITDLKKAEGLEVLRRSGGTIISVGDGLNDVLHLQGNHSDNSDQHEKNHWSIATNAPRAVQYADIGFISTNMAGLTIITDCILTRDPNATVEDIITEAQYRLGNSARVHLGGRNGYKVSDEIINLHAEGKREIREEEKELIP